jgi:hypothetical protein
MVCGRQPGSRYRNAVMVVKRGPISDHGAGLDDPLAGYLPPHSGHARGAGLWVARQMTRRVDMVSSSLGLTTRLWI